ncbi:MAG: MGH1-like glycoside hydrolase domain-containing protein [Kiritimatiellia bacterium]
MQRLIHAVAAGVVGLAAACPAEMPQRVNDELVSAYRTDLVGPEVWTGGPQGHGYTSLNGDAKSYWSGEVPFELIGKPSPGLSGLLHVVHEVRGLVNALVPVVHEGTTRVTLVPIRNRWTPAGMTTYYRGCPTGVSETEGCHVGATVVKERKAILTNNTFVAELTLKNTGPVPRVYRLSLKTAGGLPCVGAPARAWGFSTCAMFRLTERVTYVCAKATFDGRATSLEIPAHGESTLRYVLSFSPISAEDALSRADGALSAADPFVDNARAFDEWYAANVPRLETPNPDLRRMYFYRWFVVKRGTHTARHVIPDHEYPRQAIYESPNGGWFNCVIGLPVPVQIAESRWKRDPAAVRDHALNWCESVKGYRNYIQFTGHAIADLLKNHPSRDFAAAVYPAVKAYAEATTRGAPTLPVQQSSWPVGAEYQPNFYQFTDPPFDYRHDHGFGPKKGFSIAKLVRLDTAVYMIGDLLGTARLASILGKTDEADTLERQAASYLDIIRTRHWDANLGLFLAADPTTYRLADQAACYDSFAPYLWGLVTDAEYLRAFDKLTDRAWFWDDFPATTCAKKCPMYFGASGIVTPPAATPDQPAAKGCCWNGPMWHYANGLYAAAFGEAARAKADLRMKWLEFFDAWSESHWAYGDRTVPRAAEHFRPEDGARCGTAWDYFHSAWLNPFYLYRCGIGLSKDLRTLSFEPFATEDFRLSCVPLAGREYSFEQHVGRSGERELVVSICQKDGTERVLAKGVNSVRVAIEPCDVPFAFVPPSCGRSIPKPVVPEKPKLSASFQNGRENLDALLEEQEPTSSGDATVPRFTFWPHRGTEEWIALELPNARPLTGVQVYWYDDEGHGSTRVPDSWTVEYQSASGDWRSVDCTTPVAKDRVCIARFPSPVETKALRLRLKLKKGYSTGLLALSLLP